MGYYVNIRGSLRFADNDAKQKCIRALKTDTNHFFDEHYDSVEEFLINEIARESKKISELEYDIDDVDRRYNEEDTILVELLSEYNIDAELTLEFDGEDDSSWRTTYDLKNAKRQERKDYISDAIVTCKNCKYAHTYRQHADEPIQYECSYWTTIAGNVAHILMNANDYCSKGERCSKCD